MPKKPNEKIHTAGDLRAYLAELMDKIETGQIDEARARNITKAAAQINNAFYAEAKVQYLHWQMGKQVYPNGDLPLRVDKDDPRRLAWDQKEEE